MRTQRYHRVAKPLQVFFVPVQAWVYPALTGTITFFVISKTVEAMGLYFGAMFGFLGAVIVFAATALFWMFRAIDNPFVGQEIPWRLANRVGRWRRKFCRQCAQRKGIDFYAP